MFTKSRGQDLAFGLAAQVQFAIAGQHFIKKTNVLGDRFYHEGVRGGDQHQAPSIFPRGTKEREERSVVGQGGRIQMDASRNLALEESSTPCPPERNHQQVKWIAFQQQDQRLPKQVRFDKRAVEVHAKRNVKAVKNGRWWGHCLRSTVAAGQSANGVRRGQDVPF